MKKHARKMVAPIIISVIFILYFILYFAILFYFLEGIWRYIAGIIPLIFAVVMVAICIQRINEIRSGEEDDISKY